MKCPNCNREIPNEAKFCLHCGTKIVKDSTIECPRCHIQIPKDSKYCPDCGTRVLLDSEVNFVVKKTCIPDGALSGLFTVNEFGKRVLFSRGNLFLYVDGERETSLEFEPFQYMCDAKFKETTSGDILRIISSGMAINHQKNLWRTLSQEEWNYLFYRRCGARFAKAQIGHITGILLFPDGIGVADGSVDIKGLSIKKVNVSDVCSDINRINKSAWTLIEETGIVFLPRVRGYFSKFEISYPLGAGLQGSVCDDDLDECSFFSPSEFSFIDNNPRLVADYCEDYGK